MEMELKVTDTQHEYTYDLLDRQPGNQSSNPIHQSEDKHPDGDGGEDLYDRLNAETKLESLKDTAEHVLPDECAYELGIDNDYEVLGSQRLD